MSIPHRLYRPFLVALAAVSLTASPAMAAPSFVAKALGMAGIGDQRPRDQDRAFRATREGRSMPLPMIERRVRPQMGGADYLGPELNGRTYRFKFMRNGRVIWIDVDARTGRIIQRSRP